MPADRLENALIIERNAARAALGLILAVALGWRLHNIGFGLPSMYDPDEPFFMITALEMLAHGTLNPGWFGHPGSTTITLLAAIDAVVAGSGLVSGHYANLGDFARAVYADPAILFIPARVAMALIGTGCVWLTYMLGNRLNGRATGLVAAGLLAINALHISWSQIIRTDIHASLFMLASLWFAARIAERGTLRDYILAGVVAGLATATKWPAATVFVAIVGAAILARQQPVRRILAAALATIVAMAVASPFLVLDWRTVLANVSGEISSGHLGHNSAGFVFNLGFYLVDAIGGSMGLIGLALVLAGAVVLAVRKPIARWTLLPAAALFLTLLCTQNVYYARWLMPLMPMACIFAAAAIFALAGVAARWLSFPARQVGIAMLALLVTYPSLAAAIDATKERATDTRALAANWGRVNIPAGSRVLFEHIELGVRDQPWTILFPNGDAGCMDGKKAVTDGVDDKVREARGSSPIVDLGHVGAARLDSCRADFAILAYYDLYLVEQARYPAELATYRKLLADGRTVALFRPISGVVGGPVVRIVALPRR